MLDASCQGVKRLFVFVYDDIINAADRVRVDSHKKYFLPRINIVYYNIEIDGRNIYDEPINDPIKKYEVRKTATGQGDDYTSGCLLDYVYFGKNYNLIAADLSKQKALDADLFNRLHLLAK